MQEYSVRGEDVNRPIGKTLFVVNVPPYINEAELKSAFNAAGPVENVFFAESALDRTNESEDSSLLNNNAKYFGKPKRIETFKVAYIVFKMTKSLKKSLLLTKVQIAQDTDNILCTGINKWLKEQADSTINEKELQSEVESYMRAFEDREQEQREEAKQTEVDDDGWTVVKRGKVGGGFQQKESILKALEDKIEQGRKKKQFKNFYSFQIRESKQKHIVSLRKRFAADKMKIEALKKARRFKPF